MASSRGEGRRGRCDALVDSGPAPLTTSLHPRYKPVTSRGPIMAKLRRALPDWRFIHTHIGFGYRLAAEPAAGDGSQALHI